MLLNLNYPLVQPPPAHLTRLHQPAAVKMLAQGIGGCSSYLRNRLSFLTHTAQQPSVLPAAYHLSRE
jgi:hypothetical protein